MRRLVTWFVVSLGIAALLRRLRRSSQAQQVEAEPGVEEAAEAEDDPADELRRKLAESRVEDEPVAPAPPVTVEERRTEVHDQGRSALEEMREADEG
jgi:hypothetical protein